MQTQTSLNMEAYVDNEVLLISPCVFSPYLWFQSKHLTECLSGSDSSNIKKNCELHVIFGEWIFITHCQF